jgi:hypothetical protein
MQPTQTRSRPICRAAAPRMYSSLAVYWKVSVDGKTTASMEYECSSIHQTPF